MDIIALAQAQHGVVTRAQALERLSPGELRWRLERGTWLTVHPGVYQTHTGSLDWMGRASAALLFHGPGAALALQSAAHLLGIETVAPAVLQVDVPSTTQRGRRPGVRVRRRRRLVTVSRRGLTVTAPAFTVLDLGDHPLASRQDAIAVAARAVQRRRVTVEDLVGELAARRTHRHRRALELSLGIVADGAESVLEVDFVLRVVRAHGLPAFRMAVPDVVAGRSIRRDFVHDAHRIVVELDGRLGHEGGRRSDIRRDRGTSASGGVTIRAEWLDVYDEPCALAADLAATLASRGFRGRPVGCGPRCPVRAA